MDLATLKSSLAAETPPAGLSPCLTALWLAARDNWDGAHKVVQEEKDEDAAWVHAYLHRVEGDLSNAGYWYRRAQREPATGALEAEWEEIAGALLSR